jgi:predicted outer membrane repeat protein
MSSLPVVPTNRVTRRSLARRGGAVGAGGVLVAGSAAALLTALAGQAGAASTITVDLSGDGTATASNCTDTLLGNCTLRDAAALAADGDTIIFGAAVTSITLTNGEIALGAVNITGPGSALLAITTTAAAGSYNLFNILGSGDVTVSGLSITKNRIWTDNQGKFTLNDVSISDCSDLYGAALYATNSGDLVISGSHFEDNTAAQKGGAVYAVNTGAVTVSDTEFIDNAANTKGGGIFVGSGATSFSLTDSVVTGNSASDGGGLGIFTPGSVTIANSDISSNTAIYGGGGASFENSGSQVLIDGTTFDGNTASSGGGIAISERAVVMTNSTVSNNDATYQAGVGGGIWVFDSSQATFNNTTISGNSSAGKGGGVYFYEVTNVTMNQTTISNNDASFDGGGIGLYDSGSTTVELSGTIVSGNTAGSDGDDVFLYSFEYSVSLKSDHSILGTVEGSVNLTDLGGTINSTTPGLLALADNGGPTKTMALDPTSVAIDAGPDPVATFTGNGFDQRGTPYARVSNGTVDIGAFELQATPPPTSSTTSSTTVPTSSTTIPGPTTTVAVDPTTTTTEEDVMVPAFTG